MLTRNEKERIKNVLQESYELAKQAAEKKLAELESAGPRYELVNTDLSGNITSQAGYILDDCGGAYIRFKDVKFKNKISETYGVRNIDDYNERIKLPNFISLRKEYPTGYTLSFHNYYNGQEVSVFEVAETAALKHIKEKLGIKNAWVKSYIT